MTIFSQTAADDLNVIADELEVLRNLLDKFYDTHDDSITARLDMAWPRHDSITMSAVSTIRNLSAMMASPEELP